MIGNSSPPVQPPVVAPPKPDCSGTCACGVEPLAHPKYSFGMLLEPRLLALEHRYHAMRANVHNIRLHDFGTVCGLRVDKHPSPQCVNTYAILRPGIALDCCGREIVVPEELFVPLQDGATSGWCGATMGTLGTAMSASATTNATKTSPTQEDVSPKGVTKLYICLRYVQCDTDPIPTYVRACGCCSPCEHGDCTPSVTREGYEVVVTSTSPPPWKNPVSAAFCDWLQVQITGPGPSAPNQVLYGKTLDEVLCCAITDPCADICAGGNDLLLLATVTFDARGKLEGIDNVTGRRLVLSSGAILEALRYLTKTEIACCAASDPYLTLNASVTPSSINLAAQPLDNTLAYTVTVTNSDAHKTSESFEIVLNFKSGGLTFVSATLTVAGSAQTQPTGSVSGVTVSIPPLVGGGIAQLVVSATFVSAAQNVNSTIVSIASIAEYAGDHDPNMTLATTFVNKQKGNDL